MGFSIRQMDSERKFASALSVEALSEVIPQTAIDEVIALEGVKHQRERRLTAAVTLWIVIALHLYPTVAIAGVLRKLARGLRFVCSTPSLTLPGDSAIAARRQQLGARALVALFKRICRPMATPQTPGAWLFGLRAVAIDGTSEDAPDTPANAKAFGRHPTGRGRSAFPQLQGVYLVECGTHAVFDAGFWPCSTSERVGGFRLLRSLTRGMLVLWDRGFHDFAMVVSARQRGAHVLARLPSYAHPKTVRVLSDGSLLARMVPSDYARRKAGEQVLVRVISYTISDPALPGYGEQHRVMTTLLNPRLAPAQEVACGYHERWEAEITIDEIDTHQRLVGRTLRSLTPMGVIQELYGILLMHYAVRWLMHQAALRHEIDPDRLSFVHAIEVIRDAVPEFQMVEESQQGALYERLLDDIACKRLGERRCRSNPRVVKRKMSNFKLKREQHYRPPPPKGSFRDAVVVQPCAVLELPPRPPPQSEVAVLELPQREPCLI